MRVYALRAAGFQIGHGCVMWGLPTITGGAQLYTNLTIGRNCVFNVGCFFDLGAPIGIGDQVAVGHQVMLLTNSHELGPRSYRAGPLFSKPITIEDGAWLGARSVVLPGVSIGTGAVVAAGAVVAKNVAPNTIVGGVPAQVIRSLAP
jgi:maltose O-acetyltransferase